MRAAITNPHRVCPLGVCADDRCLGGVSAALNTWRSMWRKAKPWACQHNTAMQTTPRSPATDTRRWHPDLWPWSLALCVALALSAWWAWDLFQPPEQHADHPILPMRPPKDKGKDLNEMSPPGAGASRAQQGQRVAPGRQAPASQALGLNW